MKTELEHVSETNKAIKIEVAPEDVKAVYDSVSKQLASRAQVPGFRKGMATVDVVRTRFKEEIRSEVLQKLVSEKVSEAIREHQVSPIIEPHVHLEDPENVKINGSEPIVLTANIQVMPELKEIKYDGLEAMRRVRPVLDEEIRDMIDEQRKEQSTLVPIEDRKSQDGDTLIIDLKGKYKDDPDADPIDVNDMELKLGDELIEKTFTKNLLSVETDETKEFEVKYPEDFSSPALAGRHLSYAATIKSIGKVELPELNDEWVKSLDEEFKTLKELRSGIRKNIESLAKSDADNRLRNELVAELIKRNDFEVPTALIDSQARKLLDNFARDLAGRGIDLKKLDENFIESAYENMKGQAERDVRGALLLENVAKVEKIEINEESVNEEIGVMAQQHGMTEADVRQMMDEQNGAGSLENSLRTRAALDAIVEKSNISDGEWVEEKDEIDNEDSIDSIDSNDENVDGEKPNDSNESDDLSKSASTDK